MNSRQCSQQLLDSLTRRTFLSDMGLGFGSMALGAMLSRDRVVRASDADWKPPGDRPHFVPKAKSVIWLFMLGGVSQVETFDPKPALNKYAGKSIAETPFKDAVDAFLNELRIAVPDNNNGQLRHTCYPLQIGYGKRGQSGIEVCDWFPHLGGCIDDLAVVRSMWTTDPNHSAQLQLQTGRTRIDGTFPSIGAWTHYGLGSLNDDLPQFVVMGTIPGIGNAGILAHGADYLGPMHAAVHLTVDPQDPLPFGSPGGDVFREEQRSQLETLGHLNHLAARQYPNDPAMLARIKSYELAFRMQSAVPEIMRLDQETQTTQELYGLDQDHSRPYGQQLLAARRMVEKGVRFIQVYHGSVQLWDAHNGLKTRYSELCPQVDKPIAGLIKDLKQRGLLEETLIVFASEFGRTPGVQSGSGRDHHPFGFTIWMCGGGIQRGIVHGATDELGYNAVEDRHYVTDLHATVLHQLGLDPRSLDLPGRQRIELDYGHPITEIIA